LLLAGCERPQSACLSKTLHDGVEQLIVKAALSPVVGDAMEGAEGQEAFERYQKLGLIRLNQVALEGVDETTKRITCSGMFGVAQPYREHPGSPRMYAWTEYRIEFTRQPDARGRDFIISVDSFEPAAEDIRGWVFNKEFGIMIKEARGVQPSAPPTARPGEISVPPAETAADPAVDEEERQPAPTVVSGVNTLDSYAEVRSKFLRAGYRPLVFPAPVEERCGYTSACRPFSEVSSCSGTGMGYCKLVFGSDSTDYLVVRTFGENEMLIDEIWVASADERADIDKDLRPPPSNE
jgi:hypothetical protein